MRSKQSWAQLHAIEIDRSGDAPVFRQIYLQLRSAILSGTLRPATKLPATRELAEQFGVARTSVVSAFEQLIAEGYAYGKQGAGTFVAADLPEPFAANRTKKQPKSLGRQIVMPRLLDGLEDDVTAQSDARPFNLGRTLLDARTIDVWRKITARGLRRFDRQHLGYGDPRGMPELRRLMCHYLQVSRGVRCEPEQVVITTGTQHAIDIVVRIMVEAGTEVWIEDPGYPLTRVALSAAGARVRAIPVDHHGIIVAEGIRRAPKARAVFVTPSHQFPTGVALSMPRRLALLAWARDSGALIVEDDYASEFRYGGRPLASLQGLDDAERVIYIGTLNKALFPGLRLGYAIVPPWLIPAFVAARYLLDRQPSTLLQEVVAVFMEEGHFASHIRRMREAYRGQRDALVTAIRRSLDGHLSVDPPDQGMHLAAYTRRELSDVAVTRAARESGVIVHALSRLYIEAPKRSALMLGFSGYPKQMIAPAISRLGKVLKQ